MIDYQLGVRLAPFGNENTEKIFAFRWRNNPTIYKWCRQSEPLSWASHEAYMAGLANDRTVRMFAIYDLNANFVGVCGLTSLDLINRRAEFSLYIGTEHQKKGFGKMALKTLLTYAFKVIGLNCVWGESFDGNPAIKMFEGLGFKKEGTRRDFYYREGRFIDAHLFSFLRRDWDRLSFDWLQDGKEEWLWRNPAHDLEPESCSHSNEQKLSSAW